MLPMIFPRRPSALTPLCTTPHFSLSSPFVRPALLAEALKKVGFSEDRGASLDISCAGLFKFQHNTDTDLKVTHVYPRTDPAAPLSPDTCALLVPHGVQCPAGGRLGHR